MRAGGCGQVPWTGSPDGMLITTDSVCCAAMGSGGATKACSVLVADVRC
jgi:hypothetical protein